MYFDIEQFIFSAKISVDLLEISFDSKYIVTTSNMSPRDIPDDIFHWSDENLAPSLFPPPLPSTGKVNPILVPPILIDFDIFLSVLRLGTLLSSILKQKSSQKSFYPKRLQRVKKLLKETQIIGILLPWMLTLMDSSKAFLSDQKILNVNCGKCLYFKYETN